MRSVNVHEGKMQLSKLLDEVERGAEIVIAKAGRPGARLVAFSPDREPHKLGILSGVITIPDDFDKPLPNDIIDSFEA